MVDAYSGLKQFSRAWERYEAQSVSCTGLTATECRLLHWIAEHPDARLEKMASGIGVSRSRLTRLLDGLEKKKHLKRRADPIDARSQTVSITSHGERSLEATEPFRDAAMKSILACLPEAERRSFLSNLAKVVAELEQRTQGEA